MKTKSISELKVFNSILDKIDINYIIDEINLEKKNSNKILSIEKWIKEINDTIDKIQFYDRELINNTTEDLKYQIELEYDFMESYSENLALECSTISQLKCENKYYDICSNDYTTLVIKMYDLEKFIKNLNSWKWELKEDIINLNEAKNYKPENNTETLETKNKRKLIQVDKIKWRGTQPQIITLFEILIKENLIGYIDIYATIRDHFVNKKGEPFDNKNLAQSKQNLLNSYKKESTEEHFNSIVNSLNEKT